MPALYVHGLRGITDWRRRSLLRGSVLVILSLLAAFRLSHFPQNYASPWIVIPLLVAIAGTVDTVRCMQVRWSWYHGGVILCAYMDLMAIAIILFFLVYPLWL
jgi:putative effector of murein hydrolase